MNRPSAFVYPFLLTGVLAALGGCSKKPVNTANNVKPSPAPAATPTVVRATDSDFPHAASVPADAIETQSLSQLQGYLKDTFFDFDKSDIRTDQTQPLTSDGAWLRQHSTIKVRIEGNCDERGTAQYNLALGERRAEADKEYLVSLGVDPKRVEIVSYGKERPFAQGHEERAWALNRRDHYVVTAK